MSEDHVAQALEEAPRGSKMFKEQQSETTKVVLKPDWPKEAA